MASGFVASHMVFSGDNTDPYAAEDFISRFNAFASAVKWDADAKVRSVGMLLTGTVKDWFKTQNFDDWDTFCENFKAFHNRRFSVEAAENALKQRKKLPFETFDAYFYDIIRLLKQANITDVIKHIRWLTKGLSPALATQLAARQPTTTAAVLDIFHEWKEIQNIMSLENLHISASTTASKPPYPSQREQDIQQLRHELHEKDKVISALKAQSGPCQYRGRAPNSRSRCPYRRVRFAHDDDLTITRYYDDDTTLPRTVLASSNYHYPEYDSDEWKPNSTIATATTTMGLVPHLHVYVYGIPLLAMLDTGASNTIISPETALKLTGLLITEDSPPVFDYVGRMNNTFGCTALEIALAQGSRVKLNAIITDHAQQTDIILGTDFCKRRRLKVDFDNNTIQFSEPVPTATGTIFYQLPYWFQPGLASEQHRNFENTAAEIFDIDNFDIDTFDKPKLNELQHQGPTDQFRNHAPPRPTAIKQTSLNSTDIKQLPTNDPTLLYSASKPSIQPKPPDGKKLTPTSPNFQGCTDAAGYNCTQPPYAIWLTITIVIMSIILGFPRCYTRVFSLPHTTITATYAQDAVTSILIGSTTPAKMSYLSILPEQSQPLDSQLSFRLPLLLLLLYSSPEKCKTPGPMWYKTPPYPRSITIRTMAVSSELSTIKINLRDTYGDNPLRSLDLLSSHRTKPRLLVTFIHRSQDGSSLEKTSDQQFFSCHGKIAHQHLRGIIHTLEGLYTTRAFASMAIKQPRGWIGGHAIIVAQMYRDDYNARAQQQSTPPSPSHRRSPKALSPRRQRSPRATSTRHHRSPTATSTSRRYSSMAPSAHRHLRSPKAPLVHRQLSPKVPSTRHRQKFPSAPSPSSASSSSSSTASQPPPPKDRSPHTSEPSLPLINQPISPIRQSPMPSTTTQAHASPSDGTPIPPTVLPTKAQATYVQVGYLVNGFPKDDFPYNPPSGRGKWRTLNQRIKTDNPIPPSAPPTSTTTTSSMTATSSDSRKRTTPSRTPKEICSIIVSRPPSTNVPDFSRVITPPLCPPLSPD